MGRCVLVVVVVAVVVLWLLECPSGSRWWVNVRRVVPLS